MRTSTMTTSARQSNFANVSLGLEYDYFRLGSGNADNLTSDRFPVVWRDFRADVHQVVARANVTVDWCTLGIWSCAAPVVAKY